MGMSEPEEAQPHLDTSRPFTRAQFRRAGRDPHELRRRCYASVVRGVWVRADAQDELTLVRAALLLHPDDAFASHLSAAQVLRLPVPEHRFAHVTVGEAKHRRYRAQIKPHVTDRRRRIVTVRGIRCTDPIATFIDCAGWLPLVDLVVLGDAIVRQFGISPAKLRAACRRSTDYYAGLARRAAEYVRKGVDSPMETRLRMLIVLAGLPEPEVNMVVRDEDGRVVRRYDLCWPSIKLIVEYDGRHHAAVGQWKRDLGRREEIDDDGFRILVVTSEGIYESPADTLQRVRRQLVLRGWPDVPPLDDGWRSHFAA